MRHFYFLQVIEIENGGEDTNADTGAAPGGEKWTSTLKEGGGGRFMTEKEMDKVGVTVGVKKVLKEYEKLMKKTRGEKKSKSVGGSGSGSGRREVVDEVKL